MTCQKPFLIHNVYKLGLASLFVCVSAKTTHHGHTFLTKLSRNKLVHTCPTNTWTVAPDSSKNQPLSRHGAKTKRTTSSGACA